MSHAASAFRTLEAATRMEPYRSSPDATRVRLHLLAGRMLTLPSGVGVSADAVACITDTLRFIIREALAARPAAEAAAGV
jgi:hypothetical protein